MARVLCAEPKSETRFHVSFKLEVLPRKLFYLVVYLNVQRCYPFVYGYVVYMHEKLWSRCVAI